MKFSIKDFFSKCDQIRRKLPILSYLLNKFLMENFTFWAEITPKAYLRHCETSMMKLFSENSLRQLFSQRSLQGTSGRFWTHSKDIQ